MSGGGQAFSQTNGNPGGARREPAVPALQSHHMRSVRLPAGGHGRPRSEGIVGSGDDVRSTGSTAWLS
jgi:hypothetical protein